VIKSVTSKMEKWCKMQFNHQYSESIKWWKTGIDYSYTGKLRYNGWKSDVCASRTTCIKTNQIQPQKLKTKSSEAITFT